MADFRLTDAIDASILTNLSKISTELESVAANADTAAQKYTELATALGKLSRVKPENITALATKLKDCNDVIGKMNQVQAQLSQLQEAYTTLVGKTNQVLKENAEAARQAAHVTRDQAKAEQEVQKAEQQRIKTEQLKERAQKQSKLTTEEALALARQEVKSINEANQANAKLRAAVREITEDEDKEGKIREQLNRAIQKNTQYVKENSDAYVQQKMNVGNYTQSIREAFSSIASGNVSVEQLGIVARKTGDMFKGGLSQGIKAGASALASFSKQMLALMMNPVVATIALVAAGFMAMKKAIESDNEATHALQRIMVPFNSLLQVILNVLQRSVEVILNVVEGYEKMATGILRACENIPILGSQIQKLTQAIDDNTEAVRLNQEAERLRRENTVEGAKIDARVAELRNKAYQTEKYNEKERKQFLEEAIRLEEQRAKAEVDLAEKELEAARLSTKHSKNTKEELDDIANKEAAVYEARARYYQSTMRMNRQLDRIDRSASNAAEKRKAAEEKAAEYRIKLEQYTNEAITVLTNDGLNKDIAAIKAGYQKKLSEIKGNSQEEINVRVTLTEAMEKEIARKQTEWYYKEQKELSDLRLAAVKAESEAEYAERLNSLELQYESEIIAANNNAEKIGLIVEKYEKLRTDLMESYASTRVNKIQEEYAAETAIVTNALSEELVTIEQMYARKEITEKQREQMSASVREQYAIRSARKSIELLEKQLSVESLTDKERQALAEKLTEAKISLSEKETQAIINNNKRQEESHRETLEGVQQVIEYVGQSLQGVGDFGSRLYQNQLDKLNETKNQLDEAYDQELARIEALEENGSISTEVAEARKRAAKDKSERQAEKIARKQEEIEKKQARLAKATALAQATIATALAIMQVWASPGNGSFISRGVMSGIVAALGAVQLATIAATPISAYKEGTDDAKGGLSVVGDGGEHEIVLIGNRAYLTPNVPTLVDLPKHAKVIPDVTKEELGRYGSDLGMLMKERSENGLPGVVINSDFTALERRVEDTNEEIKKLHKTLRQGLNGRDFASYINSRI